MFVSFLLFVIVMLYTWLIVSQDVFRNQYVYDEILGPQKIHDKPTPRIGGLALLAGLTTFSAILFEYLSFEFLIFIFCALPAFTAGVLEDLTKVIPKIIRLLACLLSGLILTTFDISIRTIGIPIFDVFLHNIYFSIFVTILAVGFLAQAINIIDGLNGMALLACIIPMCSIFLIAHHFNDVLIQQITSTLLAGCLGLFIFNFPTGKIFLGDGGAYMLGVFLASLIILLSNRTQIAPFSCLLLTLYPMFELFFSVGRRKFFVGTRVMEADAQHFHSILYKTLKSKPYFSKYNCNPIAALFCMIPVIFLSSAAYFFRENNLNAALAVPIFAFFYILFYFALKRQKL